MDSSGNKWQQQSKAMLAIIVIKRRHIAAGCPLLHSFIFGVNDLRSFVFSELLTLLQKCLLSLPSSSVTPHTILCLSTPCHPAIMLPTICFSHSQQYMQQLVSKIANLWIIKCTFKYDRKDSFQMCEALSLTIFFHFMRLFWYHVFTCSCVRPSDWARSNLKNQTQTKQNRL